jgi:hypothetical protein
MRHGTDRASQDDDRAEDQATTGPARATTGPTPSRVSVQEAASLLGTTVEGVRSRLKRGTLTRERDENGQVYVLVPAVLADDRASQDADRSHDRAGDRASQDADRAMLVESMQDQIDHLWEQLDQEREANRENRRLLAAALERIPAIEAPPEATEVPLSTSKTSGNGDEVPQEQQNGSVHRSWWRRLFAG